MGVSQVLHTHTHTSENNSVLHKPCPCEHGAPDNTAVPQAPAAAPLLGRAATEAPHVLDVQGAAAVYARNPLWSNQ